MTTQTKRGKIQDKRITAKKVLLPTKENIKRWEKNPDKFDLKGVDTKKTTKPALKKELEKVLGKRIK